MCKVEATRPAEGIEKVRCEVGGKPGMLGLETWAAIKMVVSFTEQGRLH